VIFCTLLGAFQHGAAQANVDQPWQQVVSSVYPFAVGTTVAWCFILVSNLFFFVHLTLMWLRLGRRSAHPTLLRRDHGHASPHGPEGDIDKLGGASA
jgi:cytochrome c oxidase cbb3-type subunit 1